MRIARRASGLGLIGSVLWLAFTPAGGQSDPIAAASDAIGATGLRFVRMRGFGGSYAVGQSASPGEPWPRVQIKTYEAAIDYDNEAMITDVTLESGPVAPRGGLIPLAGERRQVQGVAGPFAWNTAFSHPPATGRGRDEPSEAPSVSVAQAPRPAPQAARVRRQQIWLTPHGFLKAAIANNATSRDVPAGTEVSFTLDGTSVTGVLDKNLQVVQVKTTAANPVLGDMSVEVTFSHYVRVGARAFPMRIRQQEGGHPSLDLWLSSVSEEPADIAVPAAARAPMAPPPVEVRQIADGVFYLTGGSHHSVAVAMSDHVVLIEAPQDQFRARAIADAVAATVPGRPIRFVVNTHHHFDHAGGLRTFADAGAVVVTHALNRPFFELAWKTPRPPMFRTFDERYVLTDGTRRLEVHHVAGSAHATDLAMVYLPAEKMLVEADVFTPSAADAPAPAAVNATALNLYHNVVRLRLDVQTIVALHGSRLGPMAELAAAAGRRETE